MTKGSDLIDVLAAHINKALKECRSDFGSRTDAKNHLEAALDAIKKFYQTKWKDEEDK